MSQLCCRVPFLVDSGDLELLDENVHNTDAIVDTTLINADLKLKVVVRTNLE